MNNLNDKTKNNAINTNIPSAYDLIAKSALESGLSFKQSIYLLRNSFIQQAKNNGATSIVDIALQTGIDRRSITEPINNNNNNNNNKFLALIGQLRKHIKNNDTRYLVIKGAFPSLQFYAKNMSGRITLPSIIKQLIKHGIIEKYSTNKVKILKTRISSVENIQSKNNLINKQISRQVGTINHNYNNPNNKLIDYSIASTQINPNNVIKINKIMRIFFNHYRPLLNDLLTKYEERVPYGSYPEYNVNFFINISEVNNNEENSTSNITSNN